MRTQERLEDLLSQEDFAGAIGLLIKCQQVSSAYQHFTCVAALEGKLKDTLVLVEEQLDVALAKVNEGSKSYSNLIDKSIWKGMTVL